MDESRHVPVQAEFSGTGDSHWVTGHSSYVVVLKRNRRARTVHSSYVVVLKENRRAHVVVFEGIFLHYGVNY